MENGISGTDFHLVMISWAEKIARSERALKDFVDAKQGKPFSKIACEEANQPTRHLS